MKTVRSRAYRFAAAAALGVAVCMFILVKHSSFCDAYVVLISAALPVTFLLSAFAIRECRRLKAAKLIVDNQILHIRPVMVAKGGDEPVQPADGMDVFISCFGILLSSRIIRFNRKANQLRGVGIGRDFICLTYGTGERTEKTRILHEPIDAPAMLSIAERFRFETGVVAVFAEY